jgi:hypothetical protein
VGLFVDCQHGLASFDNKTATEEEKAYLRNLTTVAPSAGTTVF